MAESAVLEAFKTGKLMKNLIEKDTVLQTDQSTIYSKFEEFIDVYVKEISSTKEGKFKLKLAHTAISKPKSDLRKYRMVSERKLRN